jgi:hypothetical protein
MDLFDENITTEFVADITNDFIDQKQQINGYKYNMFQSTIIKDGYEYYCERINVESERNINGINGLFFSNNKNNHTRVEGIEIDTEDPRLFICNDKIYVIFNAISPFNTRSMAISEYDNFQPVYLQIEDETQHIIEKNWSPCVVNNKLYLIYLFDPLIILHYDIDIGTGFCKTIYKQKPELLIKDIYTPGICLRGSSSFIPFQHENLYIGLCHSFIYKEEEQYYYHSYLCVLDVLSWKIVYISKPIACKSLITDKITKFLDTDIILNYNRYYYKCNGYDKHIDITVVYPTSFYREDTNPNPNKYMMVLNLNKYSLKNHITIDSVAILQQIKEQEPEQKDNPSWDTIVRKSAFDLVNYCEMK